MEKGRPWNRETNMFFPRRYIPPRIKFLALQQVRSSGMGLGECTVQLPAQRKMQGKRTEPNFLSGVMERGPSEL